MAVAKMTGGGAGKKKATAAKKTTGAKSAGKSIKPMQQKRIAAKRQVAMGMTGGNAAQSRMAPQMRPRMAKEGGGSLNTSWANNKGLGAIGYGGMRFLPDMNAKIPVYGGMPVYTGHTTADDPNLPGDQRAKLYRFTMPDGRTVEGTTGLLSYLMPVFEKAGLKALTPGSGTYRTFAESDAMHAANPDVAAPGGFSDHNYGRAIDLKDSANANMVHRIWRILGSLGMQKHSWENWHFATPDSRYTNGAYKTRSNWNGQ